jgi:CHAD domain-containing protein
MPQGPQHRAGYHARVTATTRQVKLAATPPFEMPDFNGLFDGVVASPVEPEGFSTRYFDTDDLRLARWGVSFCHRLGRDWSVRLPSQSDTPALSRPELTFSGNHDRPPAAAVDLVQAFTRSAELASRTQVWTVRNRIEIRDWGGNVLADVVDVETSVLEVRRALRLRRVEVDIHDDTPLELLDQLLGRLRTAGAGDLDSTPEHTRILGSQAEAPPEVVVPTLASGATAGDVVRRAIAASVVRLVEHDPVVRLDLDPEGVHQARVATRRIRSDLRTFGPLLEPEWAAALTDELRWLAGDLGRVRDGDVMLERTRTRVTELGPDPPDATHVLAALEAERDEALVELLESLRSERYVALLERLIVAASEPVLLLAADHPAVEVVPDVVQRPWRKLRRRVRAFEEAPTDEALHDVRIATKRVRYAAEAVTPVVGRQAQSFAAAAAALQGVLGEFNDAVVAEAWLRDWSRRTRSVRGAFAAGELAGLERARAQYYRTRWRKAWKALAAPALRAWMT